MKWDRKAKWDRKEWKKLGTMALVLGSGAVALVTARAQSDRRSEQAFFEQNVRPILVAHCYSCHSAQGKKQGGLALDTAAGLRQGGAHGPAILPGQPEKSLLLRAIGHQDKTLQMPPDRPLESKQVALLTEWVRQGAYDPRSAFPTSARPTATNTAPKAPHWAFLPLQHPTPPALHNQSKNYNKYNQDKQNIIAGQNPIDRFLRARLEARGLEPNPPATRRTLIRRATFDLIGLPPTPQEVADFLADTSPNAYAKLIDRLLASPHFGERWGRHWLDLARFAESHGYEQDYDRPYAYHYRDFVIKAFNQDLPYDQFVRWQLAGDEFDPNNPMALLATGFLAAGTHATQITKNQVEKERYDELDDMLSTTGTTFLGLTLGCARCHNHKYDPISANEYYRMLSTFTRTVRSDYDVEFDPEGYRKSRADFEAAHAPLARALNDYERDTLPAHASEWLRTHAGTALPAPWNILTPDSIRSAGGATFTAMSDGSYLATGTNPDFDTYTFTTSTRLKNITGLRLEALKDPSMVAGGPGRAVNGNFALTDLKVTATPLSTATGATNSAPVPVLLTAPRATFEQRGLPISAVIDDDPRSAWAVDPQFGRDHAAAFTFKTPLPNEGREGTRFTITLKFENNTGHNIGRLRLALTTSATPPALQATGVSERAASVTLNGARDLNALSPSERATFLEWFKTQDADWQALQAKITAHLAFMPVRPVQKALISSEGVTAVRTHTQGGDFLEQTHFLKRGDPNQKVQPVSQGFLAVLMRNNTDEHHWQEAPPAGWRTTYQRRSLANWMTDTENGAGNLLARVIVNRLWQHHFGRGLVATPSDFGTQGTPPTHPELLDYLATELIRNHWQLKPIHKLMLTCAAYCQTTDTTPLQLKLDPDNRLQGRRNRLRLEAEIIRDSMLATSGLLDPTPFGPGTLDENSRRRSIYFFIKRSRLIPSLMLFDAPNALQSLPSRASTIVAPQALMLLNSPQVRQYATALARRATDMPAPATRSEAGAGMVQNAYMLTLGRPPSATEMQDALTFLKEQTASYRTGQSTDPELLARTDFCQVLFGLNEFIYIE